MNREKTILPPDHRIEGRVYNLTEAEKAVQIRMSPSFLQKDRLNVKPTIDFARYGRTIRYSHE